MAIRSSTRRRRSTGGTLTPSVGGYALSVIVCSFLCNSFSSRIVYSHSVVISFFPGAVDCLPLSVLYWQLLVDDCHLVLLFFPDCSKIFQRTLPTPLSFQWSADDTALTFPSKICRKVFSSCCFRVLTHHTAVKLTCSAIYDIRSKL